MKVAGIDPSFTSTGVVIACPKGVVDYCNPVTTGRREDTWVERIERAKGIAEEVHAFLDTHHPGLVVIEAPALGAISSSHLDRAGLFSMIVAGCQVPVACVPPASLKLWATGSGQASKKAMGAAMRRMWGVEGFNSDLNDALALASMGLWKSGVIEAQGWFRDKAVVGVQWPAHLEGIGTSRS